MDQTSPSIHQTTFLLAYLEEQYTRVRQYETREVATTAFLTASAGAILGLGLKGGTIQPESWWAGVAPGAALFFVGVANLWINEALFKGTMHHTGVAGATRRALENAIPGWTAGSKPTEIRNEIMRDHGLKESESKINERIHEALAWVPRGVILLGLFMLVVRAITFPQ